MASRLPAWMGVPWACGWRADLADQLDLRLGDRPHGHHDPPIGAAGGTARKIADEHRYQGAEFDVARPDSRLDQGMLEGQTATKQESDQIVAPQFTDLAPAVDSVARSIGTKNRRPGQNAPVRDRQGG